MAAKEKFPNAKPGDEIMNTASRSHKSKLIGLVLGNPAFENSQYGGKSEEELRKIPVADLEAGIKDYLKNSGVETVSPRGISIQSSEA